MTTFTYFQVIFAGKILSVIHYQNLNSIFRSVHLTWKEKINFKGIDGYRYSSGLSFLNTMPNCFCINQTEMLSGENGCFYPGALDLTQCVGKVAQNLSKIKAN